MFKFVILGIIQGLTEFLPVSSSFHLIFFQKIFKIFNEQSLFFDITLHIATLLAVFCIFYKDFFLVFFSFVDFFKKGFKKSIRENENFKLLFLIFIGSIPTALIALTIRKFFMHLFVFDSFASVMLIVTGVFLFLSKNFNQEKIDIKNFTISHALIIGAIQGFAVFPGISRSGATIVMALFLKFKKDLAIKYSFLLSFPAIIGAEILEIKHSAFILDSSIIIGFFAAFVTGYFALFFFIKFVKKRKLHFFSPYCFLLGIISLFF